MFVVRRFPILYDAARSASLAPMIPLPIKMDTRLRRIFWRTALAIWLVALCSSACPQTPVQTIAHKKRVAVLDFEDDTGGSIAASGAFGADAGTAGKGISALIIAKLADGG